MNQFFTVQNFYKTILEKRAADFKNSIMPDYKLDNREIALKEVEKNQLDQRKQLEALLMGTKVEEKHDTSVLEKALDHADDDSTDTSNPLLKIAMNQALFRGLRSAEVTFLKTASADTMKVVYTAFHDELEKISADIFSMKGPGKLLAGIGKSVHKPPPIPAKALASKAWGPGTVIHGESIANNATPVVGSRGL